MLPLFFFSLTYSYIICCQVTVALQSPWCIIFSHLWSELSDISFTFWNLCRCLLQSTVGVGLNGHLQNSVVMEDDFFTHVTKKHITLTADTVDSCMCYSTLWYLSMVLPPPTPTHTCLVHFYFSHSSLIENWETNFSTETNLRQS